MTEPNETAEPSGASGGYHWLRVAFGVAANMVGLACVVWPVLPKSWGAWKFVGRIFHASDDTSMGIQYMFFWMMTVPVGGLLSYGGTKTATRSNRLAAAASLLVVVGGVYAMFWIGGQR